MKRDGLLQKIYDATNNGQQILFDWCSNAQDAYYNRKKFFKLRDEERTPSAAIKEINGIWRITDFGDDSRAMSPIELVMKCENIDFREALFLLADRYKVGNIDAKVNKPEIESRPATTEEKEGHFEFELNPKMTEKELQILGPMVNQTACDKYSYYSVKWYSITKDRKTTVIKSTENFPIYMHDCGEFKKIYKPMEPDKAFRFFYKGNKPKNYINGFDVLQKKYKELLQSIEDEQELDYNEEKTPDTSKQSRKKKLSEAIFCSGERDAINLASMGYCPLWLNSETALLSDYEFREISKMVEKVYNVPDIDTTGTLKGAEMALTHIELYTIELPEWIKKYKDNRGNPRKDLRDFLELKPDKFEFEKMMSVAKRCQFWEAKLSKDGAKTYRVNSTFLLYFLKLNGYGKYIDKIGIRFFCKKDGYKVILYPDAGFLRQFVKKYLNDNFIPIDVQNLFLQSKGSSSSILEDIEEIKFDFKDYSQASQLLFFANTSINITKDDINLIPQKLVSVSVLEQDVQPRNFKLIEPAFSLDVGEDNEVNLKIKHTRSHFFSYLINGSRMFWREEFEMRKTGDSSMDELYRKDFKFSVEGVRLYDHEIREQRQHLINKIYTVGYLLHRYKSPSKAMAVWFMENKITEEGKSNGGSGKSLFIYILGLLCRVVSQAATSNRLKESRFLFDRIDEHSDIFNLDDAHKYFALRDFFSFITGNFAVEKKTKNSVELPFEVLPKLTVTSNYPPQNIEGSYMRRLLFCVFSDYYHSKSPHNDYLESRTVADDFGYDICTGSYSEEQYNADFNFMANCLQAYLAMNNKNVIYQPPMENVIKRINLQLIGEEFLDWATVYFSEDSENLDNLIDTKIAMADYNTDRTVKMVSRTFTTKLMTFCQECEYIQAYNPLGIKGRHQYKDNAPRISRHIDGKMKTYYYVQSVKYKDKDLSCV